MIFKIMAYLYSGMTTEMFIILTLKKNYTLIEQRFNLEIHTHCLFEDLVLLFFIEIL